MNEATYAELAAFRREIIESEFSQLNNKQQEAVYRVTSPLLILAGAGSGKTTVLVNRIANILRWGRAYETDEIYGEYSEEEIEEIKKSAESKTPLREELVQKLSVSAPAPWRILAITFTNKAAAELKERICNKVGEKGLDIWASTFHSACGRILRSCGHYLGYTPHFTVYDTDDQKRLVKDCLKALNMDEKMLPPREILSEISNAKDNLLSPEEFSEYAMNDIHLSSIAKVYKLYQNRLLQSDAMDFDDMIFNTVVLLKNFPDVLEKYGNQFKYIMVDEYQDTNHMQYELIRLLSSVHNNLCVVGDDDQSIYKFRGASIRNILDFENTFENAYTIKLEQNYRSTQNILTAANQIIKNNIARKDKTLWTDNEAGEKIICYNALDERDESNFIAETILNGVSEGKYYKDYAILYRMNSQSQNIERALVRSAIPYRIIGGKRFYERREIRDMIAYLSVISNHNDDIRLKRIINVPKRAIGNKTASTIEEIGNMLGQSMFETMKHSDEFDALLKSHPKLADFCSIIEEMSDYLENGNSISEMYSMLIEKINYIPFILKESDHGDEATENIRELKSSIVRYEQENPDNATLQGFLEEIALLTDIDSYNTDDEDSHVVLMTLHSAKGLEFDTVFIPGMEENIFPGYLSTMSEEDMQEERRLAYVGVTRAKRKLYLINSDSRTIFGRTSRNKPSRFLDELPEELIEKHEYKQPEDLGFGRIQSGMKRKNDMMHSRVISSVPTKQKNSQTYSVGMRVRHKTFGDGLIVNTKPMASDTLLEIAFDDVGTKKLMANYTNLTIIL